MIAALDLKKQYKTIKKEVEKKVQNVLRSGSYVLGQEGAALEKEFSDYCGSTFAVGLNSGTDALYLALLALGVGPGDEVITTSFSFIATANTISHTGAKPVFVDVRRDDATIDVSLIEKKINSKTKAIMPVHLYGFVCEMDAIVRIAKKHGLYIVEDCAQSIGAKAGSRMTGSIGQVGCFSFYPTKNLGACGDGGMAVTSDAALHQKLLELRTHGSTKRNVYAHFGINSRLDEIQAAIVRVKLRHIDKWNKKRGEICARYDAAFKNIQELEIFKAAPGTKAVYHLYTLKSDKRIELVEFLSKAGVQTALHYPIPMHRQKIYHHLGYTAGSLPVSEKLADQVFSIPLYPELSKSEQKTVIRALQKAATTIF